MPDAPTLETPAAPPAPDAAAVAPPDPAADDRPIGHSRGSFEDVFSKAFAPAAPSEPAVLSGDAATPASDDDEEPDDGEDPAQPPTEARVSPEPTPETPPEQKPLSRREQERQALAADIARLTEENARILAERETEAERIRAEARTAYETDQQRQADEATARAAAAQEAADVDRYHRLNGLPTDDPRLLDVENDERNWEWLDNRRRLLTQFPQAERAIRAEAGRFVDAKLAELDTRQKAFWSDIYGQMGTVATGLGLDPKAWEAPGTTWASIADAIQQTAEARATERVTADLKGRAEAAEAEVLTVRKELQDLRDQLLGTTRAPAVGGRSPATAPEKGQANYRGTWQENLHAAFG